MRYAAHPSVVSEEIDGEAIAINFETGAYFSFLGWSAWTWRALQAGLTRDELSARIHTANNLEEFVSDVVTAGLLVERGGEPPVEPPDPPPTAQEQLTFERFDDMADMILMDPIHDVDPNVGWPKAPAT